MFNLEVYNRFRCREPTFLSCTLIDSLQYDVSSCKKLPFVHDPMINHHIQFAADGWGGASEPMMRQGKFRTHVPVG